MFNSGNILMENPQRILAELERGLGNFVAIHMAKLRLARLFQLGFLP